MSDNIATDWGEGTIAAPEWRTYTFGPLEYLFLSEAWLELGDAWKQDAATGLHDTDGGGQG